MLGSPPRLRLSLTSHLFPGFPFTLGPPAGGRGCTEPSPGPSRLSVLRACRAERRIRGPQRWEQRDNGSIVIWQPGPAGPNCSTRCPEHGVEGWVGGGEGRAQGRSASSCVVWSGGWKSRGHGCVRARACWCSLSLFKSRLQPQERRGCAFRAFHQRLDNHSSHLISLPASTSPFLPASSQQESVSLSQNTNLPLSLPRSGIFNGSLLSLR